MKNFNILGVHGNMHVLGGKGGGRGVHKKPIHRGDCLKEWAWTICNFKWGTGVCKKEGGVFLRGQGRGDTPMHTMK